MSPQGERSLPATLGRYQLLGEIASGGAATVYLARMLGKAGFERSVAVKVLHQHLARDPEFVAMFLDEARLSARVQHPNVVDVYDVDAVSGELIIVMEYVEGAALSWLLRRAAKREEPLALGLILTVVHDALMGLHAAHELTDAREQPVGLIHRDVSPQNILVGTDGITRVTDFGVAKAKGRIATTIGHETVKGKIRYLAPEQIQRGEIDRRVDVFAAGIVLWETLTGQPLVEGDTDTELLAHLLAGTFEPPSKHRSGLPPVLDKICLRALARQPSARYATAAAFATALDRAFGPQMYRQRQVGAFVKKLAGQRLERAREALRAAIRRAAGAGAVGAGEDGAEDGLTPTARPSLESLSGELLYDDARPSQSHEQPAVSAAGRKEDEALLEDGSTDSVGLDAARSIARAPALGTRWYLGAAALAVVLGGTLAAVSLGGGSGPRARASVAPAAALIAAAALRVGSAVGASAHPAAPAAAPQGQPSASATAAPSDSAAASGAASTTARVKRPADPGIYMPPDL